MPGVTIRVDTTPVEKAFDQARKQIPFAITTAINDVAFQVQRSERDAITALFRNPRAFTQKSVFVTKASKATLTATVRIGDAQAKYLEPYEVGGLHELPGQALLNPKNVSLDAFGQLRKGQFKNLAAKPNDFVGTVDGISGLWQRPPVAAKGSRRRKLPKGAARIGLKLLVRFGIALPVNKRMEFVTRADALVTKVLPKAMADAIAKAISTMRP